MSSYYYYRILENLWSLTIHLILPVIGLVVSWISDQVKPIKPKQGYAIIFIQTTQKPESFPFECEAETIWGESPSGNQAKGVKGRDGQWQDLITLCELQDQVHLKPALSSVSGANTLSCA